MTMQEQIEKYKLPTELGIPGLPFAGLVALEHLLRDGKIPTKKFDMRMWWRFQCGCIGGWLEHIAALADIREASYYNNLLPLLYPLECEEAWDATPKQAAKAIRNYLTTGDPKWVDVVSGKE